MEGGAGHRGCGAEVGWQLRQSGGGERWSFTTIGQPVGNLHNTIHTLGIRTYTFA